MLMVFYRAGQRVPERRAAICRAPAETERWLHECPATYRSGHGLHTVSPKERIIPDDMVTTTRKRLTDKVERCGGESADASRDAEVIRHAACLRVDARSS